MKELVDLYAKLLIGTFTFIGPSFTLLISLFQGHFERIKARHESRREIWVNTGSSDEAILKEIKKNKRELSLLDPKRQVKLVYGSLLCSIILIGFYYFQHTHFWSLNYGWVRVSTIFLSLALFLLCLGILWVVFGTIIAAKKAEKAAEKEQRLQSKNILQTLKNQP